MKEKLKVAPYPEKNQILTLIPDTWSHKYCSNYFEVSEYLVRTARALKKDWGFTSQTKFKKGENNTPGNCGPCGELFLKTTSLVGKSLAKNCVSLGNKQYKQKRLVLCNLNEIYADFKEKNPTIELKFSKFCSLCPKW